MVDWVSLSVPVAYLSILVGSLYTFSTLYRKRQATRAASLEPWFGEHIARDVYLTLWHQEEEQKVPPTVIKAALLRRAAEDVNRIIQMRSSKQALSVLLARGSVGDDLWQRFQRAEKELEAELQDVLREADALSPGWGQSQAIFQSANEMAANTRLRKRVEEIQAMKEPEKQWWEKKRANTRDEFMKELDQASTSKDVQSDSRRPSLAPSSAAGDKLGSDEDGVLVEAGSTGSSSMPNTPSTPTPQGGEGGGKKKKKKGKK